MSQGKFFHYDPTKAAAHQGNCLILDGPTLANLEIIQTEDGNRNGSLLGWMDKTKTPFGKRLLEEWVKMPLSSARDINARLDAIDELRSENCADFVDTVRASLALLPDLERYVAKIHASGRSSMMDEAILFDNEYGKKQVRHYMKILDSLHNVRQMYVKMGQRKQQ